MCFVEVVFLNTVSLRQKKALFLITDHVWQETRLQFNCIIYRIITVHMTGLVIPSANNIVKIFFYFKFQTDYSKAYIFQQDITPIKINACVYSRDYFLKVKEPYM